MEVKVEDVTMESCAIGKHEEQNDFFNSQVATEEEESKLAGPTAAVAVVKTAPVCAEMTPCPEEVKRLEKDEEEVMVKQSENIEETQMEIQFDAQDPEEKDTIDNSKEKPATTAQASQQNHQHQVQDTQSQSEEAQFDKSTSLGRNRRVRQKNRYFLDFHCIDLTKGARSVKDDYESAFTAATSTRRSTIESNCNQNEEPVVFETKYCRKCSAKTAHDLRHEGGACQVCLYNEIVESHKKSIQSHKLNNADEKHQRSRQRPASQRNRSSNSKQNRDNELESSTTNTNSGNGSKRKATKQGGSRISSNSGGNKCINNSANNINTNVANTNAESGNINININDTNTNATKTTDDPINTENTNSNCDNLIGSDNNNSNSSATICNNSISTNLTGSNKLPRLDSWTPDEVAEYIMSKGFANEAELFKTQSVDGISLLLMQRTDFTYGLKIKLGPALKIYDQVCKLKKEYFRNVTATN